MHFIKTPLDVVNFFKLLQIVYIWLSNADLIGMQSHTHTLIEYLQSDFCSLISNDKKITSMHDG